MGGQFQPLQPVAGPSNAPAPAPAPTSPSRSVSPALSVEEDLIVHPASVISLLRSCGYTDASLLFPLFYALSCTTWQFGGAALGHHLAPLSVADMERLVVGIERVRALLGPDAAPDPAALHAAIAGLVAAGSLKDPVLLTDQSLQCLWRFIPTPEGLAAAVLLPGDA